MRLKTLLAAAAMSIGLLAHAEYADKAMSFESMTVDAPWATLTNELETADSGVTWDLQGNADVAVKAYVQDVDTKYTPRPSQFELDTQTKYLSIKTPLTNGVIRTAGATIDGAIYVDTLVKFTAADDDLDIPTDGKIAVWAKAMDEDGTVNHLMVTAGPVVDQKPTTYDCGLIENLDAWHRLTIKVIGDVTDGDEKNGLVVYLDAKGDTVVQVLASETAKSAFAGYTLTDVAAEYKRNGQLFEAMKDSSTLASVEFAGQGSVDDIVYTETQPAFAADPMIYTVAWEEGVKAFDYTPYNGEKVSKTGLTADGEVKFVWDGENKPTVENVVVGENQTYAIDDTTVNGLTMISVKDLVATGVIDGNPATFTSIEDMVDAVNGAKSSASVKLGGNVGDGLTINNAEAAEGSEIGIVIDLAGKTVTGGILVNAGYVTITNTTAELGKVVAGDAGAVVDADGDNAAVILAAGCFDGAIGNVSEFVANTESLQVNVADNESLTGYEPDGYMWTDQVVDGYWTLTVAEKPTATVIFVCQATGYNNEKTVNAGEPFSETPASADVVGQKGFLKVVAWKDGDGNDFEAFTPVEGETYTFTADLDINLDKDTDGAYEVTQAADLVTLKDYVADGNDCAGKTFKQTANINFADVVVDGGWDGIGTSANKFAGTFDGGEYKFYGVLDMARKSYGGLFGECNGATIKNVTFDETVILLPPTGTGSAGYAVIGRAGDNTKMINIKMSGWIGTEANPCNHNVAGIAVSSGKNALFENCVMNGELYTTGPNNDHVKAGGMVAICSTGDNATYTTFKGCTVSGSIHNKTVYDQSKPDDLATAGALCGYSNSGIKVIDNCDVSGVTFDVTPVIDELASVDCGMFFGYCSDKFEVTNTTAAAGIIAVGSHFNANNAKQLWLATINSDKVVYDAANATPDLTGATTYKVMLPCASFTLAEGDKIALDETVASATVTAADTEKCEIKYEGNVYECVAKAVGPTPIDPSDPKAVIPLPTGAGTAEEFAATINDDPAMKAQLMADPTGVTFEDAERAAYQGYFKAAANAAGDGVTFVLNEAAVDAAGKTLEEQVTAEVAEALTTDDKGTLNVAAVKGLYYGISQADSIGGMKVTDSKLATGAAIEFTVDKSGDVGFYKIIVSATEIPVENK